MTEDGSTSPEKPIEDAAPSTPEAPADPVTVSAVDAALHATPTIPATVDPRVIAVSVVGHLLLAAVVAGSILSVATPPEAIPITFVPVDPTEKQTEPPDQPEQRAEKAEPAPQGPQPARPQAKPPNEADQPKDEAPDKGLAPSPEAPASTGLGFADFSTPSALSPDLLSAVRAQILRCWSVPSGWSDPHQVAVTVRFRLNRDGTLAGSPSVVEFRASALGKAAADSAIAAIGACAPFQLPPAEYARWSDIQLELEP